MIYLLKIHRIKFILWGSRSQRSVDSREIHSRTITDNYVSNGRLPVDSSEWQIGRQTETPTTRSQLETAEITLFQIRSFN